MADIFNWNTGRRRDSSVESARRTAKRVNSEAEKAVFAMRTTKACWMLSTYTLMIDYACAVIILRSN